MNFSVMLQLLGNGMLMSISIFLLTLVFSLPLGMVVAFGRMSKNTIIRGIVKFYISVMRGTPLMLQLILVYFGPHFLFGVALSSNYRFIATIIGFSLNYAAYFAEIYRGGIESMPKGQYEAAEVLGFDKFQTFFKIILPQVVKRVLPAMTNETITLVKDTSLASAISMVELFDVASQIAASKSTIMPIMVAGLFYYVFNFIVAFIMEKIEKRLSYYK
ncbi:MAG: amino acid ABC transporter permease [Lachnospiraceae bacterium]|nr:amino acid ABC transporter permease [Lachnospiraceae bacterium]